MPGVKVDDLVQQMREGDRSALARLISLIERGGDTARQVLEAVHPYTGTAYVVGITGPPGAGKSTLVDALVHHYRQQGLQVGVLAVDPSSPFTGGAFLGDRVRMQRHYLDPGVFIRSMATRGSAGGLPRMVQGAIKVMDASGRDLVLVETVGVGQTELEVMQVADTVVLVLVPEAGDAIQTLKAGILEIADILVVNKADREGASRLAGDLEAMLNMALEQPWWRPPVLLTQAHKGEGVDRLVQEIARHRQALEASSRLAEKRRARVRREFLRTVEEALSELLHSAVQDTNRLSALLKAVEEGRQDPYATARQAVASGFLLRNLQEWLAQHARVEQEAGGSSAGT